MGLKMFFEILLYYVVETTEKPSRECDDVWKTFPV